jgi:hypothetical protein
VGTNISEKHTAFFFRVKMSQLGKVAVYMQMEAKDMGQEG